MADNEHSCLLIVIGAVCCTGAVGASNVCQELRSIAEACSSSFQLQTGFSNCMHGWHCFACGPKRGKITKSELVLIISNGVTHNQT